jgi:hypothetical protein
LRHIETPYLSDIGWISIIFTEIYQGPKLWGIIKVSLSFYLLHYTLFSSIPKSSSGTKDGTPIGPSAIE